MSLTSRLPFNVGRAVENARSAAESLVRQIDERRAILPRQQDGGSAAPGDVVRLSREECVELLRTKRVGRYAYVASARTLDVLPVNYVVGQDDVVFFATGPGNKLLSADRREVVAFQVDDINEEQRGGWSVLVVGRVHRLSAAEADALPERPVPWAGGPRVQVVAVVPSRVDGRRLIGALGQTTRTAAPSTRSADKSRNA